MYKNNFIQLQYIQTRILKIYLVFQVQSVPGLHQLHSERVNSFFGLVGRNLKQTKVLEPATDFFRYVKGHSVKAPEQTLLLRKSLIFLSSTHCLSRVVTVETELVFSRTAASSLASTFFNSSSSDSRRRSCSPRCWTRDRIWKGAKQTSKLNATFWVVLFCFLLLFFFKENGQEQSKSLRSPEKATCLFYVKFYDTKNSEQLQQLNNN